MRAQQRNLHAATQERIATRLFCRPLNACKILSCSPKTDGIYVRQKSVKFHRSLKLGEILLCPQRACGIYFGGSRKITPYTVKPSEIDSDLSFKRRGLCILAICARAHGCYFKVFSRSI